MAAAVLTLVQGCTPDRPAEPAATADGVDGWVTPPQVLAVARAPGALSVSGTTAPHGRVVVHGDGAAAYATSADDQGRFALSVTPPALDALFVVETRNGQEASPAPYRLLVSHDPAGPIALLAPGVASLRLDPAGALDVVDSDGQVVLASGRSAPSAAVSVRVDGGAPTEVRAGRDGRWTLTLNLVGAGPAVIEVGDQRFAYPGAAVARTPGLVTVATDGGRRLSWSLTAGSGQSSWFPTR